ncbi:MAG: hypothetical protein II453_07085 [Alphaproteobacteria bacterium]|nr:hypothetical protein [Alphaproteobacteria bacterium]
MSEKELRIAIYETDKKFVEGNYGDFYNTMTKADAMEKIGKAIAAKIAQYREEDSVRFKPGIVNTELLFCLEASEAALDAILGAWEK